MVRGARSSAREKALMHLEKLMRKSTTVGAGIFLACSVRAEQQRPPEVCDPLPPPIGCCENPDQFLLCVDVWITRPAGSSRRGGRWS